MKPLLPTLLVSLLLVLMGGRIAVACTCAPTPPVVEAVGDSDFVFTGRVVAKEYAQVPMGGGDLWDGSAFTFAVERVWKGEPALRLVVVSGSGGGDCGYHFQDGQQYLVYAKKYDGQLYTNICTRTAPIAQATADLAQLPEPKAVYIYVAKTDWLSLAAAGAAGFLLAMCLTWFVFRRRQKS